MKEKEKLSLIQVCKIPDVQIHSKTAFLKALINLEKPEALQMKDQIISLSYTVKTIGVQGDEVGITSKRLPLKLKKKQESPPKVQETSTNFLPHKTFYSHALIPLKKDKELIATKTPEFLISSVKNMVHIQEDASYEATKFKIRTKSMGDTRRKSLTARKPKDQKIEEFGKIKEERREVAGLSKKSFSCLLRECYISRNAQSMNPLMHEQNPLFKKIKKIKQAYPETYRQKAELSERPKTKFSSSSNLFRIYREEI